MSFLGRLFNRVGRGTGAASYDLYQRRFSMRRPVSNVQIDADTALRLSVVWGCIDYLTKSVGQLPWCVMRDTGTGKREEARTHPVQYLIAKRPNAEMGAMTWRRAMLGCAMRWGNAYSEIEWDAAHRPVALHFLHPTRVTVRRDDAGVLYYNVANENNTGSVDMVADDVFHLRGYGEGPVGLNVVEYAAESMGWAKATELFGASFFGEGLNPTGVVETKSSLTPGAMGVLRDMLKKVYKGIQGERTMILDKDMTWKPITVQPDNAQFVETRAHQVAEICRWFGVPPHKVMHLADSHYNNIEHQGIEVVTDTIAPWAKAFEEEADYKLFGANRASFYTRMQLNGLMRGDSKSRGEFYKLMRETGAYTVNDILALEDMNGIGKDGDIRIVPANMTRLEKVGEVAPPPAKAPGPATTPGEGSPGQGPGAGDPATNIVALRGT